MINEQRDSIQAKLRFLTTNKKNAKINQASHYTPVFTEKSAHFHCLSHNLGGDVDHEAQFFDWKTNKF